MPRKRVKRQNRSRGWGSVGQGAGGEWWAQIPRRVDPKRPIKRGFATSAEAHEWLDEEIKAWIEGRDRTADQPFGAYLDRYLARREPFLAQSVRRSYRAAVSMAKAHDDGALGRMPLGHVTHEQMGELYADWRRQEYALSTIRKLRTVLSAAFNEAVPHVLPANPNIKARVPKPQLDVTCWDLGERNRFLGWVYGSPRYALWLLFLTMGPRPEELRGLKRTDLDRESGRLTIARGLSDDGFEEGPTKSRRERKVILHPPVFAAITALIDGAAPDTPWLFPNPETGQPWHRTSLGREMARGIEELKIPEIRLYDGRHTAATIALSRGGPVADVSYMLGHANPAVTLEYYSHWLPSGQDLLARLIGETVPDLSEPVELQKLLQKSHRN